MGGRDKAKCPIKEGASFFTSSPIVMVMVSCTQQVLKRC